MFNDIFSRKPVDKIAGLVTSCGFSFNPIKQFPEVFKDIPLIIPSESKKIGYTFGRLTVIGKHNKKTFVCRCSCGNYIICSYKRIKNAMKNKDLHDRSMCNECDYLIYIRNGRKYVAPISPDNRTMKLIDKIAKAKGEK